MFEPFSQGLAAGTSPISDLSFDNLTVRPDGPPGFVWRSQWYASTAWVYTLFRTDSWWPRRHDRRSGRCQRYVTRVARGTACVSIVGVALAVRGYGVPRTSSRPTESSRAVRPAQPASVRLPNGSRSRVPAETHAGRCVCPVPTVTRLRPACPADIPVAAQPTHVLVCAGTGNGCLSSRFDDFEVLAGGVNETDPSANCPPGLVHVTLYAGALGGTRGYEFGGRSAFPFNWPAGHPHWRQIRSRALMIGARKDALLLWRGSWYGKTAISSLLLQVSTAEKLQII